MLACLAACPFPLGLEVGEWEQVVGSAEQEATEAKAPSPSGFGGAAVRGWEGRDPEKGPWSKGRALGCCSGQKSELSARGPVGGLSSETVGGERTRGEWGAVVHRTSLGHCPGAPTFKN